MQLDLFTDNRRTIYLNEADEMLCSLNLARAESIYADLLADYPGDGEILAMREEAAIWWERLAGCLHDSPADLHRLHSLLAEKPSAALRSGLLAFLIDRLQEMPFPELVYIPPRFHLGCLLREGGRYTEAAECFAAALGSGDVDRGRFFAWLGDALTLAKQKNDAMECYFSAFLEDPATVDLETVANRRIRALLLSLSLECFDEEVGEREAAAWLPFWGWMQAEFPLPLNDITADRAGFAEALQKSEDAGAIPAPRLWFNYLRYAEYLRSCQRDDNELVRVRRKLRMLHPDMFARYMEKIGGVKR